MAMFDLVLAALTAALVSVGDEPSGARPTQPPTKLILIAPDPDKPVRAQTPTSLASLFSTDDYPQVAIRNGESGTVAVEISVNPDGTQGACVVTSSSNSAALDEATCNIIQRRAMFKPARDRKGRAVADKATARIRWELPQPEPDAVPPDGSATIELQL